MNRLVRSLTLPLLARELTEQAARKRTCVVRTICALALTVVAMLVIYEEIVTRYERNPLTLIGQGRIVVEVLIICLFCGVFFLQPAITCGVITSEKERNTLGLLFLTRLGPWSLVLEKLISRLIPMTTVLLLSLPLLAIAYSMGGVSLDYLWSAVWLLAVSAFQIGALALLCSTLCRTTASAFMRTYLVALVFYFGWPMLVILDIVDDLAKCSLFGTMIHPELVFFGPYLVFGERIGWPDVIPASVPIMASGMVFLIAARIALTRRAFVHQRHTAPRLFRTLDNVFGRMSSWLSGHRDGALPVTDTDIVDPVAWQESRRGGANRFSHQIYACIGATILLWILLACFSGSQTGRNNWGGEMLALISGAVWILALIAVCVRSASLVAGERF